MKDRHGNRVPLAKRLDVPPLWLVAALLAQAALARAMPLARFEVPGGWLVVLAGIGLILWSGIHFRRARTPIHPRRKPTALLTTGPFALSRNPIYLGMALVAAGWAVRLGALSAFLPAALFVLIVQRRFIAGEEYHIGRALGEDWRAYAERTRRWL